MAKKKEAPAPAETRKDLPQLAISIKGFVLEADDPFAAGVMRSFLKVTLDKDRQRPVLPFVLPEKDPATAGAIKDYIVRASGGGDKGRTEAAKKALKKLTG